MAADGFSYLKEGKMYSDGGPEAMQREEDKHLLYMWDLEKSSQMIMGVARNWREGKMDDII